MPIFRKTATQQPPAISSPYSIEPTRRRRTGEIRARPISILISPPSVSERDSSLYKHEATSRSTSSQPTNHSDASYAIIDPSQLLSSPSKPPSLSTSSSSSSSYSSTPSRSSSYRSTNLSNLSRPTTWIETPYESSNPDYNTDNVTSKLNNNQGYGNHQLQQQPFILVRSKFVEQDSGVGLSIGGEKEKKWKKGLLASFSSLDLSLGLSSEKEEKKEKKSGFRGFGMNSEIWIKTTSTEGTTTTPMPSSPIPSPPVVPPRSQLRPNHRTRNSPPPKPTERNSSLYLLPVDAPIDVAPSLSSSSSSDHEHEDKEPKPEAENSYLKQKRGSGRGSVSGDPMKVRDGAMSRKASSGLYTPPTFPGAQGPRPSHFPSHVYTPQTFNLYPSTTSTPPIPSRSVSTSSTASNESSTSELRTPSSSRFGMSKTLSSIRRISNQITHTSTTQLTHPIISSPIPTPVTLSSPQFSPTNSYFPTSTPNPSNNSNHTSWSSAMTYNFPITPLTKTFGYTPSLTTPGGGPGGLGVGVGEGMGIGPLDETDGMVTSVEFDEEGRIKGTSVKVLGVGSSPVVKGRRKPVPKMLDLEIGEVVREGVEGGVHAL